MSENMKRLFKVVDTLMVNFKSDYFENKQDAKKLRNELNEKAQIKSYRIARGPDHWKKETFPKISKNTEKKIERTKKRAKQISGIKQLEQELKRERKRKR